MSNLIIRKARKDYVCDCCGHIIAKGSEYIDNVVLKYGSVVKHERYHDECPAKSETERLFKRIMDADGDLIASTSEGNKVHIVGIAWPTEDPCIVYRCWLASETSFITIDSIKDWVDEHGERILSKDEKYLAP